MASGDGAIAPVPRRPRTGLVLGAGGVLGAAWMAGALAALQRQLPYAVGTVDLIVGTSAGSALAAALRCGVAVDDIVEHQRGTALALLPDLSEIDRDAGGPLPPLPQMRVGSPRLLLNTALAPHRVHPWVAASALVPQGRARHTSLQGLVRGLLAQAEPQPRPVTARTTGDGWAPGGETWVMAVDYDSGRRVAFGRAGAPLATLPEAVVASCSIPGWYRPTLIAGRRYVDGGVHSTTSLDLLADVDLDEIYVLAPMASYILDSPRNPYARLERQLRRLITIGLQREARKVKARGIRVTVLTPRPPRSRHWSATGEMLEQQLKCVAPPGGDHVQQLTGLDAAFLAMETRTVFGHVGSVCIVDPSTAPEPFTLERFTRVVESRLPLVPPLRRRLVDVPLGLDQPYWIEDPDFDIEFHVRELALPSPGSDRQLAEQAARLHARPLDRSRPLWEIYLIFGLEGGRAAIYSKVHHAAIDGVSGNDVLAAVLDLSPEGRKLADPPPGRTERQPGAVELLARSAVSLTRHPLRAVRLSVGLLRSAPSLVASPALARLPLVEQLLGRDGDAVLSRPGLRAPRTPFNRSITQHRRWGFCGLSLSEVKRVKNAHGITVNDVVMALCAGALRR